MNVKSFRNQPHFFLGLLLSSPLLGLNSASRGDFLHLMCILYVKSNDLFTARVLKSNPPVVFGFVLCNLGGRVVNQFLEMGTLADKLDAGSSEDGIGTHESTFLRRQKRTKKYQDFYMVRRLELGEMWRLERYPSRGCSLPSCDLEGGFLKVFGRVLIFIFVGSV